MIKTVMMLCLLIIVFVSEYDIQAQDATDPYLWLEEIEDEKTVQWVQEQNESTLPALTNHPGYLTLLNKNIEVYNSNERIASPDIHGDYIYNFWQDEEHERGIWRRTRLSEYQKDIPAWKTLIDIDSLSRAEDTKWVFKGSDFLYPGSNRCMISLSPGGGDAVEIREFDVDSCKFLSKGFHVPTAKSMVSWQNKNALFVSSDFGKGTLTTSGYPRVTKMWKRGTALGKAKILFEGDSTDVGVWGYAIHSEKRVYEFIRRSVTFFTGNLFTINNGEIIKIEIPDDASFHGVLKNQMIIELKSDWSVDGTIYQQGALLSVDYDEFLFGKKDMDIIFNPEEKMSISSVSLTKNLLILNILNNVSSELYECTYYANTWKKHRMNTPDFGQITVTAFDDISDRYFFTFTNFLSPTSLYFVEGNDRSMKKLKSLPHFFDATPFEVSQLEAVSSDGVHIPYFLVHRKGLVKDGKSPTLLYGYGGFEVPMLPYYSATIGYSWLDKGGVYVLANIRGGGEFGPGWHQAALKEKRQIAFDDFIAVAEDLIHRKITSPEHLGIMGGSNGGLLVGAVFTQRPELFNAVVCQVPLLDMKRYSKLLAGASWMGEYGDPDNPDEWRYISKYSPYHNVLKEAIYPKVLFVTSTRDDRVHPGHARKMVAKMKDMDHDVLYYENVEGGHASASTNDQRAVMYALTFTFLRQQLACIIH